MYKLWAQKGDQGRDRLLHMYQYRLYNTRPSVFICVCRTPNENKGIELILACQRFPQHPPPPQPTLYLTSFLTNTTQEHQYTANQD